MIFSPTNDFSVIMEEQGQDVIIKRFVRTIDDDGKTIELGIKNIPTKALVDEYKPITEDVIGTERTLFGNVKFTLFPSILVTQYDRILWENNTYTITKIKDPTKVVNEYLYRIIECTRESNDLI